MPLTTGRQPAHTLGAGDRFLIARQGRSPREVTVSRAHYSDGVTTVRLEDAPARPLRFGYSAVVDVTRRAPRPSPAAAFGLGRQAASSLTTGDRYIAHCSLDKRYAREVTVADVWDNVDGSFTVHHQHADPIRSSVLYASSPVHVLYRAPRCDHGRPWDLCEPCADIDWPHEVETAHRGKAAPRADA
ncbi:hypothetical protein H114_32584 [Streptomyces gancidicus BKS 13-15]|uniref:Uncharacterized protein n=1 Tax=Streptomyces gancidicus BKS 13-15 TaxID=1284664 RepID=M3C8H4_STREZ|nr:hypothetical protein [Streptomyces gancidicus]EMF20378.1 hypothetical protein H114_32584 [Streptomyces gancidicus BKS 13-15]